MGAACDHQMNPEIDYLPESVSISELVLQIVLEVIPVVSFDQCGCQMGFHSNSA